MAIWTAVRLPNTRIRVVEDLLARVGRISSASAIDITSHITIGVSDIVLVSGVELVVCEALEGLAPENNTLLEREPYSLQEQCVLKSTKMFQMVVLAQGHMQAPHAKREMLGKRVDSVRSNRSTVHKSLAF